MIMVIAKSFLPKENSDKLLELAKELVEITRKQEGCIKYEMYQDENDPKVLIMIEEWETKEALDNHTSSDYYKRIVSQSSEYINKMPEVHFCKKVL